MSLLSHGSANGSVSGSTHGTSPECDEAASVGVPPAAWAKVAGGVQALTSLFDEPLEGGAWQAFGEKLGVKGYRRPGRYDEASTLFF